MDRLPEGLQNSMGYSQTFFVFINDCHGNPQEQFVAAIAKCMELVRIHHDGDNVTVHVWLSFGFLMTADRRRMDVGPVDDADGYIVEGITQLDGVATRPIFVMLNTGVRFNQGKLSQTGQIGTEGPQEAQVARDVVFN